MTKEKLPKLIAIVGPTASGKTSASLELAREFHSAVISADSRQLYKKMDIGTGKELGEWRHYGGFHRAYFVGDIPHFLVDVTDPGKPFTLARFRDQAIKFAKLIRRHKALPMLVGGTGLYISSVIDNLHIPQVPPNNKLRRGLEQKTNEELWQILTKVDPEAAQFVDQKNKRRIIRALEVCIMTGEPFSSLRQKGDPIFDVLVLGIDMPREVLYQRINTRIDEMMSRGLIKEIEGLLKQKYSWELPSMSSIGYRQFRPFFEGQVTLEAAVERLKQDTRNFARRQLTWFRRDSRIVWCKSTEEMAQKINEFLVK